MRKSMYAVPVLVAINVLIFIAIQVRPELSKPLESLALYFPENPHFRYWQVVTTMFMHADWAHLFFNMFALWSFGELLEKIWGYKKFLLFYFASGIGASIIYLLVNYFQFHHVYNEVIAAGISPKDIQEMLNTGNYDPEQIKAVEQKVVTLYQLYSTPAVGASGAIYGILVAFGMLFPNARLALLFLPVPIAAKYFIPLLIAMDLFSGLTGVSILGRGIAHFAHVGGAVVGFLLMWVLGGRDRARET